MIRARGRASRVLPGLALLFAACHAPAGWIVPDRAIEALEEDPFPALPAREDLIREVEAILGRRVEPRRLQRAHTFRVDLDSGPLELRGPRGERPLDRADAAALVGLRTGDIVLAKNAKPQSLGSTLSLVRFTFFDHAGLFVEEDGRAFVYEARPRLSYHPSAPDFASRFRGGVHRSTFTEFLERYEALEFVRPAASEDPHWAEAVAARARESLDEGILFDPHHDPADPRLSCTEYLEYLFEGAGNQVPRLAPVEVSANPSLLRMLRSLGFQTRAYAVPDSYRELPGARVVGLFARHRTRAEFEAIEEGYRALHADFHSRGSAARIGGYLAFDRWHFVRYRRRTELFLRFAVGLAVDRTDGEEDLARELRELLPAFVGTRLGADAARGIGEL
ncbi:MAG TPA: hypothetical protein ENJ09_06945 [Planctomycetes bacterium]|nr:hypothetical protein [Planctomycetota bacterium]